jgi:hypothetical protein
MNDDREGAETPMPEPAGPRPDGSGAPDDEVARQREDEARFRAYLEQAQATPKGLAYWQRAAMLNRFRVAAYELPAHPNYPLTPEDARLWARRESQGLPPNPAHDSKESA